MTNTPTSEIPKLTISSTVRLLEVISNRINKEGTQGIFLWGPPGIGKSDLVRYFAKKTDREFIDIRLSTIDPVDLRGLPTIDQNQNLTKWLSPSFLPTEQSGKGILFLDEINAAPPSLQASAYQLILDRKLGDYKVPDDWIVIAAGNRLDDRSVVFKIPTALSNRFTHLEIIVSPTEWYEWAWQNGIDPLIISFLRYEPKLLLQFDPTLGELAFPTPRSWAFCSTFQEVRELDMQLYFKGIQGTIGSAAAQHFLAFLKYKDVLPDPNLILNGGRYDKLDQPDQQHVMLGALVQALLADFTDQRVSNYLKFASGYQKGKFADYGVLLVKELMLAATSLDGNGFNSEYQAKILSNDDYKNWVKNNLDLLE